MRNRLMFYGGVALFAASFYFYAYVVRGTAWAIPVFFVGLAALALVTVADTEDLHGPATRKNVMKVALYTIGFNIAGGVLFGLASLIWRSVQ